jgi:dTMP kinase
MGKNGTYIAIEAMDLAGKTTQISLLEKVLSPYVTTFYREPGGCVETLPIREYVLKENRGKIGELMFVCDRAIGFDKIVKPALEAGKTVISDRCFLSAMAFNKHLSMEDTFKLSMEALDNTIPDIIIWLEIPWDVYKKRLSEREDCDINHFDDSSRGVFVDRLKSYTDAFDSLPDMTKIIRIDGGRPIDEVHAEIMKAIKS